MKQASLKYLLKGNMGDITLIFICYFLSLRYIFPGYFNPVLPHHSDQIDYYRDFQGNTFWDFFVSSRVVGDFLLSLVGMVSYQSILLFGIVVTILNILLIFKIYRNIIGNNISTYLKLIFLLLIFSHPTFYINYTYDIFSTIALFFFLVAILIWYKYEINLRKSIFISLFVLLSLLTKETYGLSIIVFFIFQVLINKNNKRKYAIYLTISSILLLILTLIRSKIIGSAFVSFSPDKDSPYFVSYDMISLFKTFLYYLKGGVNFYIISIIFLVFMLSIVKKKFILEIIMMLAIGLSAYIPYSVLPNHVVPHYVWVAVPLISSVILVLSSINIDKRVVNSILTLILILNFTTTLGYKNDYTDNMWAVFPENVNKNIYKSLNFVKEHIEPEDKVLITGLYNTEETWYKSMYFVKDTFDIKVNLTVLNTGIEDDTKYTKLKNIGNVNIEEYNKIFVYDTDGILKKYYVNSNSEELEIIKEHRVQILYPEINTLLKQLEENDDWYLNMELGKKYLNIKDFANAESFLLKAVEKAKGENPYPSYFMGQLKESMGDYTIALSYYEQAIKIDDSNNYFFDSLERVKALLN
ncbi:tetratricopeptide repeat protein [Lysinibacillus fusiformis]|uniref:tetratricopeptide repeat protein n=1 Tax=Lysinibacillus fusiformis TaxID=28031 RepID=UPI00215ABE48|nr:hypothetical protein [Lysinibacillus fusiformis]MCR8855649.1 hypothetical protein [Lysinibacillus fusiformis]WKT77661.1 hypothetical protein QYY55_02365 [Lysinibacillus fusiformis]